MIKYFFFYPILFCSRSIRDSSRRITSSSYRVCIPRLESFLCWKSWISSKTRLYSFTCSISSSVIFRDSIFSFANPTSFSNFCLRVLTSILDCIRLACLSVNLTRESFISFRCICWACTSIGISRMSSLRFNFFIIHGKRQPLENQGDQDNHKTDK